MAQVLAQKLLYRDNVMFFYYILNRETINYSHVPLNVFTKHFPKTSRENLKQTSRIKVPPVIGWVCGFKILVICILSSK